MQKNQDQQGSNANQGSKDQQSQSGGKSDQQGDQKSQLTPSGGSNGSSNHQSQSGGGRDQHGSNLKGDHGQGQGQDVQQGSDHGNRSEKQR